MTIKILNLYAGIGGNRKLWDGDIEVTAVEIVPEITKIYQDFFPQDNVIIADAHQYLLEHFEEFDFIWSSPPCPSHSSLRKNFSCEVGAKPIFPDMKLYEEIILLWGYFKGKWVVENVIGYYEPLVKPQELQRHYFWSNFIIPKNEQIGTDSINLTGGNHEPQEIQIARLEKRLGFDLSKYKIDKRLALRNCVNPKLAEYIFKLAFKEKQMTFESSPLLQEGK